MSTLTTGRAMAFEKLLVEDAIMLPQYQRLGGRGIVLAKSLNRPFSFTRQDTAYSKTLDFLPANWKGAAVESIGGNTLVWNQLFPTITGTSPTVISGITSSVDADGHLNVSGSVASNTTFDLYYEDLGAYKAPANHKLFYLREGDSGYTWIRAGFPGAADRTAYIATHTSAFGITVRISLVAGVAYNFKCRFSCIDLTLMFGAGNEPSTVAEFQQVFPSIDPAYNAGTLISAGVTGAVSVGVNLWDEEWEQGTISNTTGQPDPSGTNRLRSKNFIPCFPNTKYCAYCGGGVTLYAYFYDINKNFIKMGLTTDSNPKIDTSPSNAYFMKFRTQDSYGTTYKNDICINVSNPAINGTYIPYKSATLPIPAAVQQLPGYGWSAGTAYNYIDWQRKVYVQRVGSVDLGTLSWSFTATTGQERFFASGIANEIASVPSADTKGNILCHLYVTATFNDLAGHVQDKVISEGTNKYIQIYDSGKMSMTTTQFKSSMSGVMLYYELATPVETDISSLLSDDNLIAVEPGGTLTFENQLGDDYRLPVPTKVKYMRRINNS